MKYTIIIYTMYTEKIVSLPFAIELYPRSMASNRSFCSENTVNNGSVISIVKPFIIFMRVKCYCYFLFLLTCMMLDKFQIILVEASKTAPYSIVFYASTIIS